MDAAQTIPKSDLIAFIQKEMAGKSFIFYTISGAHLYGFPSIDSDYDIRGCHSLSARELCGLSVPKDFIEITDGFIDFVSFDIKKELNLMLRNNSNVLEHIFAPHLIAKPSISRLKNIAGLALSKKIFNPYHGLAMHNWKKYIKSKNAAYGKAPAKKYLYVLRSQMAGIFALEQGKIEPNICTLNRYFNYSIVDEIIALKVSGSERGLVDTCNEANLLIEQLWNDLDIAYENSTLPEFPPEEVLGSANEFLLDSRGVD